MKITSIVINYRHGGTIGAALSSLNKVGQSLSETIVVDNSGDLDDSLRSRAPARSEFIWMRPARNLGYAAAANLAVERATGDLLLFLNPDAEILWFNAERTFDVVQKDVGVLGASTEHSRGELVISWGWFPGWRRILSKLTGAHAIVNRRRLAWLRAGQIVEVQWVVGAAVLIRKGVFRSAGGFSEEYFSAGEDQDFARKLLTKNLATSVSPTWRVTHEPRDPGTDEMKQVIRQNDRLFLRSHGSRLDQAAQSFRDTLWK